MSMTENKCPACLRKIYEDQYYCHNTDCGFGMNEYLMLRGGIIGLNKYYNRMKEKIEYWDEYHKKRIEKEEVEELIKGVTKTP